MAPRKRNELFGSRSETGCKRYSAKIINLLQPVSTPSTKRQPLPVGLADSGTESLGGTSSRLRSFFFPILWRCVGFERMEKASRHSGDFIDRRQERGFVGLRRLVETADLSYELQRRGSNLLGIDRRIEVEEGLDIPAHGSRPQG